MLETTIDVKSLYKRLDAVAPGQLRAVHRYSDVPVQKFTCAENQHWVVVTTRDFNIHEMRRAYRAQAENNPQQQLPIIVSAENFPTYLKTNPVAAEQIASGPYFGKNGILASLPAANCDEKTAHFAKRLLQASSLITQRCFEDGRDSAEKQFATLNCAFNIAATQPLQQFVQIMSELNTWVDPIPQEPNLADAPACLPELQAIYDELDGAILVLPHNAAHIIEKTDWQAVADHFAGEFSQLQITTTTQLKLMAHHQFAVGFAINRFKHTWGTDLLADAPITHGDIARTALRFILKIACEHLPQLYFTLPDDQLGKLIHDIQNHLLKVQLQYDLLCFLHGLPRGDIPALISTREMSQTDRIDAIREHIDCWVDYYKNLLQTSV